MSKNIVKTIEELSLTTTVSDLWDEMNQTQNPSTLMHYMPTGSNVTIRFLGPFIRTQRFYAPFLKCQNEGKFDIEGIADKNPDAIQKLRDFFANKRNSRDRKITDVYPKMITFLRDIDKSMTWQKCIMVNGYIKGQSDVSPLKIVTLTPRMADSIMTRARNNLNTPLSGLFAHDVSIIKNGDGLNTVFDVRLLPPSHLSEIEINYILSNGLIDIPTLIKELNNVSSMYYYRLAVDYRMPEEFTKVLMEARARSEESAPFNHAEEHINEIPHEAFERRNNMREAIGSLDLDE